MKIQLSPTRRVKDVLTIWGTNGPEVDMIANPNYPAGLSFNEGFLDTIYDFGALAFCEPDNLLNTLRHLLVMLKPKGRLIICEMSFEYLARAFMSTDISLDEFNGSYNRQLHFVREDLSEKFIKLGIGLGNQKAWNGHPDFPTQEHEFVLEIIKP